MSRLIPKPNVGEYAPYTIMYISLLPDDGRILAHLETNMAAVHAFVESLPENKLAVPHQDGEWTVKQVLCHIIDDERIYCYRALRAARNDTTALPGFDPDQYEMYSNSNDRSLASILEEYKAVRRATITFFQNLDDAAYKRVGQSNDATMSVRAAVYHIAGHELHHLESIKENYG